MPIVEISGWRTGFRKISCTELLRDRAELSLQAAKAVTDRILDGERVIIAVESLEVASQLARQLSAIGADDAVLDPAADV